MDSAPESSLTCCGSEIQVPFPVNEKVVQNVHLGIRVSSEATSYAVLFFSR
jgi:hypothetical protein